MWPSLPLAEWRETRDTLHMWLQMVGKTRLALAPRQNHWWNVVLYLTARGLTTSPMPFGGARAVEIEFDLLDHRLRVTTSEEVVREQHHVRALLGRKVDGLIVVGSRG